MIIKNVSSADFLKHSKIQESKKSSINFKGYNVHILDGAAHGDYIEHFAKAVFKKIPYADVNIKFHKIRTNPKISSIKQLDSLEENLKQLNQSNEIKKGDYVTIPGGAIVPLLNLKDRISSVLYQNVNLTPENVKYYKNTLLSMLKKLYDNRSRYAQDISYMDGVDQSMGNVYGVIQEINKLIQKGVHVYIPSGHPEDNTIKWMAKQKQVNQDLYRLISHPKTAPTEEIDKIRQHIRNNNWYDFNLFSLSDANIVNVNGKDDKKFIFASFDSCVNDEANGVYNLSPVRDNWGKVKGYSFFDETTNEYPYNEFPHNEKTANINKFVGLNIRDVLADNLEIQAHKLIKKYHLPSNTPDKLYKMNEILDESEIRKEKLNYLGNYINREKNLVFDIDKNGKVLFHKLNYEGSDKPSVFAMWGCCFATINAIKRDIQKHYFATHKADNNNSLSACQKFSLIGIAATVGILLLGSTIGLWKDKNK